MSYNLKDHYFAIGLVALVFFDQTDRFLRYHEARFIDGQGQPIGIRRPNNRGGDRLYSLDDIRQMAYILRQRGIIDGYGLNHCIDRLNSMEKPVFKRNPK